MEVRRIFDLTERYLSLYQDKDVAVAGKKDGKWYQYSISEYIDHINNISYGLLEMGYTKGDKIATVFTNNRPEWNIMDLAILQAGMIHVPVYPTISDEDHKYILTHSDIKLLILSDNNLYKKLNNIASEIPAIKEIFTINEVENARNWQEIITHGRNNAHKHKDTVIKTRAEIGPHDMATILYTSGTTGSPKGVMLSHNNLVTNFIAASKILPLEKQHRVLSFLPLCHVYERMMNYAYQYKGISIYYAENLGTIADDLKFVKPHAFNTVPRLLERFYDRIINVGKDLKGFKRMIFFWAVRIGNKYKLNGNNPFYKFRLNIARKLVFSKWRQAFGNEILIVVCGGSSLQPRLERIFYAAGVPVLNGYGLTETSPVISVNNPDYINQMFGTVGPVLENIEVKIDEDGEILCKGPNVMIGYYKDPEFTRTVIDQQGWFHTGDIGRFEKGRFLKITDRKKEIFKNSAGKYVAPQVIENMLKESDLIEQVMIVGESEKFVSALIAPDFNYLKNFAVKHKIPFNDNPDLIKNPVILKKYQEEINKFNKKLGQIEQIKRFKLVPDDWTPDTGALSPTLKLKRKFLYEKYDLLLKEIYSYSEGETNKALKDN